MSGPLVTRSAATTVANHGRSSDAGLCRPQCVQRDTAHGGSTGLRQPLEQAPQVLNADDRDQAAKCLGTEKRIAGVDESAQRSLRRRLAKLTQYLGGDHLPSGKRVAECPDQAILV